MTAEPITAPDDWERHRLEQILEVARGTSPAQRLAWLEEALRLAHQSGALARERAARYRTMGER